NPLFSFYHDTLGWGIDSSVTWTHLTFRALVFGVPLLICFMYSTRPLRFGLGIGVLLLGATIYEHSIEQSDQGVIHSDRSYFGILRIRQSITRTRDGEISTRNTSLMHGTTHHGLNYQTPADLRRLATTYYHGNGPVGVVMRGIDWF